MNAKDILEIEEMYFYYEQGLATDLYLTLPNLFSRREDVSFTILRTGNTITGYENIKSNFGKMKDGAPKYDTWHTGAQICVPLIDIEDNGEFGTCIFPTTGYFIYVQDEFDGYRADDGYDIDSTWEIWFPDVVKDEGLWKIHHFRFISMTANKIWKWNADIDSGYASRCDFKNLIRTPFNINAYSGEVKI